MPSSKKIAFLCLSLIAYPQRVWIINQIPTPTKQCCIYFPIFFDCKLFLTSSILVGDKTTF